MRPRQKTNHLNSAVYSKTVVGSIRNWCKEVAGRAPGTASENFYARVLGPLFRGLEKFSPNREAHRLPILQQHLRLVRDTLDLEGSQVDRTLWALWLTQWQGVLRSGDLIRSGGVAKGKWSPEIDTHRGRLAHELVTEEGEHRGKKRLVLELKPTKTDQ